MSSGLKRPMELNLRGESIEVRGWGSVWERTQVAVVGRNMSRINIGIKVESLRGIPVL